MTYWVWLKGKRKNDDPYIFRDSLLPGIIPQKRIEHTYDQFVEAKLRLCDSCEGNFAHVIEEETGRKFCPILFADLVKPPWTAEDLL